MLCGFGDKDKMLCQVLTCCLEVKPPSIFGICHWSQAQANCGLLIKVVRNMGVCYFFVAKEGTKKASLAAMAGFVATRGRVLPIDQISRAYDEKMASISRKEPGPERAEPESATILDRLV
jgi:hypothetical protein